MPPPNSAAQSGQGLVEYVLILILVAVVVILVLATQGTQLKNLFSDIAVGIGA